MLKSMVGLKIGLMAGLITLIASPSFARSISMKEGGTALWIFLIIGAIIILLQLIPAMILFFSFVGTATGLTLKKKRVPEEDDAEKKVIVPGYEPAPIKK